MLCIRSTMTKLLCALLPRLTLIDYSLCSFQGTELFGGGKRIRTAGLLLARQALSQLSYTPIQQMVGLGGLEPPTSRLSGVRSSHLSYKPTPKA